MRKSLKILLTIASFAPTLSIILPVSAQERRPRVIQRIALPDEPVEVLGAEVGGRAAKLNAVFDAEQDWLKGLKVRMRNTSDKSIVFAEALILIPKSGTMEHPFGLPVRYGRMPPSPGEAAPSSATKPVPHGKVFELTVSDQAFDTAKNFLAEHKAADIVDVKLAGLMIIFEDDTGWNEGLKMRRDTNNPGRWKSGSAPVRSGTETVFRKVGYAHPLKSSRRVAALEEVLPDSCYMFFESEYALCGTQTGDLACIAPDSRPRARDFGERPEPFQQKKRWSTATVACEGILDCGTKTKTVGRALDDPLCGYSGGNETQ